MSTQDADERPQQALLGRERIRGSIGEARKHAGEETGKDGIVGDGPNDFNLSENLITQLVCYE